MTEYQDKIDDFMLRMTKEDPMLKEIIAQLAQGLQNHDIRIAKLEHESKEAMR